VKSDNSHYSIFKDQRLLSTKCRKFSAQHQAERSTLDAYTQTPQIESRLQSAIANRQCPGGGEGIRTPDPMVANHVLCQLSYTPLISIANCQFPIAQLIGNRQLEIGNELGCGGGI
jgi:hypothetical protein